MTTRSKVILVLMGIALLIALFVPLNMLGLTIETNVFLGKLIAFYVISSVLLCWVGAPAGWYFAKDNAMGEIAVLVFAFIGLYLSLPIAIVQVIKSRY